ncbi:MAG: tetratricopeptide repeat protein [Nitrospinota bacterium]|nr:MAG: tetratricopeptide repeat protein [Nitrospinota bacterium]
MSKMSIINDALKKAEAEKGRKQLPAGLLPTAQSWRSREESPWQHLLLFLGALCSSLLFVFAVFYLYRSYGTSPHLGGQSGEKGELVEEGIAQETVPEEPLLPAVSPEPAVVARVAPLVEQVHEEETPPPPKIVARSGENSSPPPEEKEEPREVVTPAPLAKEVPVQGLGRGRETTDRGRKREGEESLDISAAAEDYFQEGLALQEAGKWEEAIIAFQKALALDDQLLAARNNLGNLYFRLGRYEDAQREYQEAIMLDPSYAKAHNNLGNVLAVLGEEEKAIEAFQSAIALDPTYATPYYNLGSLYARRGEREKALNALRKAISLNQAVRTWLQEEPEDYQTLREDKEFQALLR